VDYKPLVKHDIVIDHLNRKFMKKIILVMVILLPVITYGQTKVVLTVNQPPEFGFELMQEDTTITSGNSLVLGTDLTVFGGSGEYRFLWSPGRYLSDSTLMNPQATIVDTTTFFLTVIDALGCSFTLNYTVNVSDSITNAAKPALNRSELTAKLFPNPSSGRFKIELKGEPSEKVELYIFDNNGRIILQRNILQFTGEHIETIQAHLPGGVYNLQVISGKQRLHRQFIIN